MNRDTLEIIIFFFFILLEFLNYTVIKPYDDY